MSGEETTNPGPAETGAQPSEPGGARDTNAAKGDALLEKLTELVEGRFAKIEERLSGFDHRHKRQMEELRANVAPTTAKPNEEKAKPGESPSNSEVASLREELAAMRKESEAAKKRVALSEAFEHPEIRGKFATGAEAMVRKLVAPEVSFNSAGEAVIDDGERQTPLLDAVKGYLESDFLRAPRDGKGLERPPTDPVKGRASAEDFDWRTATPEQFQARREAMRRGQ